MHDFAQLRVRKKGMAIITQLVQKTKNKKTEKQGRKVVVFLELHILAVMSYLLEKCQKFSGLNWTRNLTAAMPVQCSTVQAFLLLPMKQHLELQGSFTLTLRLWRRLKHRTNQTTNLSAIDTPTSKIYFTGNHLRCLFQDHNVN